MEQANEDTVIAKPEEVVTRMEVTGGEVEAVRAQLHADAATLAAEQAEMESLWFAPSSIEEGTLQKALRHLHAVIEGDKDVSASLHGSYGDA